MPNYHEMTIDQLAAQTWAGVDLTEADLRNLPLDGVDFTGSNLTGADFTGAQLKGANFTRCRGAGTMFRFASMAEATLECVEFGSANFGGAQLTSASLEESTFVRCSFEDANMHSVNGEMASFVECVFAHANLVRAAFLQADLDKCDFMWANLHGVNFTDAKTNQLTLVRAALSPVLGLNDPNVIGTVWIGGHGLTAHWSDQIGLTLWIDGRTFTTVEMFQAYVETVIELGEYGARILAWLHFVRVTFSLKSGHPLDGVTVNRLGEVAGDVS